MEKLSDFTKGQTKFLNKGKLSDYGKRKTNYTQEVNDVVAKILKQYGDVAIHELQSNLDNKNSNASFNLRQSIAPVGLQKKNKVTTYVFEIAGYYVYVDAGRGVRKANVASDPPLREKILEWLNDRAIIPVKERKSAAFLIARKINKYGTKGNKFFSSVIDDEFVENLTRELSIALKTNVIKEIVNG